MTTAMNGKFNGSTSFTDTHDAMQAKAGSATWLTEYLPVIEGPERKIVEVLLWMFTAMGLCCTIAGDYAMYIGGKLASHPDVITMYVAYDRQSCSPDVSAVLQFEKTSTFSLGGLVFENWSTLILPGKTISYVIRYGQEIANLKIFCVENIIPCGPRSNIDFVQYVWSHFYYYCGNYAVCVLPLQNSNNKIVYVRHYRAEIGGEESRLCGSCVCTNKNPRMYYSFGCKRPGNCTCALCRKQPLSLKTMCSKIVFGLFNENSSHYDDKITCDPIETPRDFFLFNMLVFHSATFIYRNKTSH